MMWRRRPGCSTGWPSCDAGRRAGFTDLATEQTDRVQGDGMSRQPRRAAAEALRGAPADADPAAHRALHGAAGRRRAVPLQRRTGRTGRGQPAVRHPLRRRPRLRRLPGAAQAPARGRARGARRRAPARTTSTSRPCRPRSRTCGTWPRCSPTPRPVERAGRLLAASRPLPVLGLRAASAQARGFAYFARQGPPRRTAAGRGRHDARRPHRRGRGARARPRCCASRCPATRARSSRPWPTRARRG